MIGVARERLSGVLEGGLVLGDSMGRLFSAGDSPACSM